jgi:hypothetical protein
MNAATPPSWSTPPQSTASRKCITHVSPLKLGQMLAAVYGLMSLIIVPFFLLASLAGAFIPHNGNSPNALPAMLTGVFAFILPVVYAVMGFILGVIMGAIYNLVAKYVGGVEITLQDAP